jgi:hypothetical protein
MRSLNTGFTEMCALVHDFDFDVFGVSETWLQPGTPSDNYNMPGYTMLRCDRSAGTADDDVETGGGVALYIKQELMYQQHTFATELEPGIEALCVVLKVKRRRLGLCVVYRPPDVRYTCLASLFHSLFVDLAVQVNSVICIGDTNVDLKSKTSCESKYLRRLLKETNTIQLINEPTRVTATSATLLDHIIVDKSAEIKRNGVVDAPSISDHRGKAITDHKLIYCEFILKKEKMEPKIIRYRDFSRFNVQEAVKELSEMDWKGIMEIKGVDNIENAITSKILKVYDTHAPITNKKVTKRNAPWRNNEIKELIKKKNKLRNKYWKSRSERDWETYKSTRNELNKSIWRAKKNYFTDKISSTKNSKDFWTCLKQCDVHNKGETQIVHDFNINEINKYFAEMGSDVVINNDTLRLFMNNRQNNDIAEFKFVAVTEEAVKAEMNTIKSKAVGSDEISIEMIKTVSPFALESICYLINESLKDGVFPQAWKESIVRPLPKATGPTSVEQLRPISILPAISKILEKIVIKQINEFVNAHKLLPKLQSGFRKNYSTCTALTNLFSDMIDNRDKGRYSSLVMLDYSKAFDSMDHDMLIAKMHYFGFSDEATAWFRSYLKDRLQVTRLGSETSVPLTKQRGVPQGSCLGPILYTLYTADFPNCVKHCTAHLYADDSQLLLSYEPELMREAFDQINTDLQNILKWSVDNGLKLNSNKCTVLHTAPLDLVQTLKNRGVSISLDSGSLAVCDQVKTLGVVLDKGLTFTDHVTYASQRALGRLRGLYRFRSLLPEAAKVQIVQSLILSVFSYCFPAYGNSLSREDLGRIQKLQNSAVRFIFCLKRSDHVSPYREAVKLLPMETVCRILTCCMTHRVLTSREPDYLCERLSSRDEVSERRTRHGGRLHFPRVNLEFGRRSFSYFGPQLYNELPDSLKLLSTNCFKLKLKEMFFDVL